MPRDPNGKLRWKGLPSTEDWERLEHDPTVHPEVQKLARAAAFWEPELMNYHAVHDDPNTTEPVRQFIAERILGIPNLGVKVYQALGWTCIRIEQGFTK